MRFVAVVVFLGLVLFLLASVFFVRVPSQTSEQVTEQPSPAASQAAPKPARAEPVTEVAAVATAAEIVGQDWPHYRGPARTGISEETGFRKSLSAKPTIVWEAEVAIGFGGVAVADGRAIVIGNSDDTDTVYCFDAKTGKSLWRHTYPCKIVANLYEGGPNSTPTIAGGRVYTFGKEGQLFCLDAKTGAVLWESRVAEEHPQFGYASSPVIGGDRLFLNVGAHGMAVNLADGKVLWSSGTNKGSGYASAVPFTWRDKAALAIFADNGLACVDPESGKQIWHSPWKTKYDVHAADPIPMGDRIFISSGYERGCALLDISGDEPKTLWEHAEMRNQFSPSILWQGHLFGIDGNNGKGRLVCLNAETGAVVWNEPKVGFGSLILAADTLIILNERGYLHLAEASTSAYKELAKTRIGRGRWWAAPTLAHGLLYARSARGSLLCVDLRP
ncbi:MAG: outer membrane protein assembly factor BamB [Rhodothermales bacterium]|jgi:outer membrane protein assembly factor BamB